MLDDNKYDIQLNDLSALVNELSAEISAYGAQAGENQLTNTETRFLKELAERDVSLSDVVTMTHIGTADRYQQYQIMVPYIVRPGRAIRRLELLFGFNVEDPRVRVTRAWPDNEWIQQVRSIDVAEASLLVEAPALEWLARILKVKPHLLSVSIAIAQRVSAIRTLGIDTNAPIIELDGANIFDQTHQPAVIFEASVPADTSSLRLVSLVKHQYTPDVIQQMATFLQSIGSKIYRLTGNDHLLQQCKALQERLESGRQLASSEKAWDLSADLVRH